jgi:hypothetical protein
MARISVKRAPAYAAGFAWESEDDVLDVPDDQARELIKIGGLSGFYEVQDSLPSEVFVPETEAEVIPPPEALELPIPGEDLTEALEVAGTVRKRPTRKPKE